MAYVIYAEKADVGTKIAAALDGIVLPTGKKIGLSQLAANTKTIKDLQKKGFFNIQFDGHPTTVTWGYGHMYCLKDAKDYKKEYSNWSAIPECFIPDQYELKPVTSTTAAFNARLDFQRKIIRDAFNTAEKIIVATDYDREGELIFAYIYQSIGCKAPYVRACFTSQTQNGIRDAFNKLRPASSCKNIEMAARARSEYDWGVGINCTVGMTLKNPGNGVLSVGRVQTTVLEMIVAREKKIADFKPEKFWTLNGEFETASGEKYNGEHSKKRFSNQRVAENILNTINGARGVVSDITGKQAKKDIPLLYSQTLLQMEANERFGYTPDRTLSISQWLYEQGYATYPRTKSQYLNDDMKPVVVDLLNKLGATAEYAGFIQGRALTPDVRFFDSSKVDSHFAIIPTEKLPDLAALTDEQRNIYDMLATSVIRLIYEPAVIENRTVTTVCRGEAFVSKGVSIIHPGWMAVKGKMKEEKLPNLQRGETVAAGFAIKEGATKPPARYTDNTILAAMKSAGKDLPDEEFRKILADPNVAGIGTDATRAAILHTLVERKYISRRGKTIIPTQKAIDFIDAFPIDEVKSPEFTARMEQRLQNIANGKDTYSQFMADAHEQIRKWCHIIAGSTPAVHSTPNVIICPLCGCEVKKHKWGWGCVNYVNGCKVSLSAVICDRRITDDEAAQYFADKKTAMLDGFFSKKKNKKFRAVLTLDETSGGTKFVFR